MKPTKSTTCKLLALAAAGALFIPTLFGKYDLPVERVVSAQTSATNFADSPPEISSMTASPLSAPTSAGNARLVVKFAPGSGVGSQITVRIDDRDVLLRDDGQGGDAAAADGKYSGVINLDFQALASNQSRIDSLNNPGGTTWELEASTSSANADDDLAVADNSTVVEYDTVESDDPYAEPVVEPTPTGDELTASVSRSGGGSSTIDVTAFSRRAQIGMKRYQKVNYSGVQPGQTVPLYRIGTANSIDPEKSLVIRDLSVVQDTSRTFNPCTNTGTPMGKWTFGYLMTQLANQAQTGVDPRVFTRQWLNKWLAPTPTVNGFTPTVRQKMQTIIIDPWEAASGGPGQPLDLSKAPFRLLSIVNRIDLRRNNGFGGRDAGEGRFVFSAIDRRNGGCATMQFTVIFEYGIDRQGNAVRDWAQQWYNLSSLNFGPQFNTALQAITEQFVAAGVAPSKPNGSALNQLRTNEIAIANASPDDDWQLREFRLFDEGAPDDNHLRMVTVKLTPDTTNFRISDSTARFINHKTQLILQERHDVPEIWEGNHFLGGFSDVRNLSNSFPPDDNSWRDGPTVHINNREARHKFSLNTCNACHATETGTTFTHVKPAAFGVVAGLSGFMTGISVADPVDGSPTRTFNEFERRALDLDQLVNLPSVFQMNHHRTPMTH